MRALTRWSLVAALLVPALLLPLAGTAQQRDPTKDQVSWLDMRTSELIGKEVVIEDSIVCDSCTIGDGARIRRAIIDRHNTIPPGARIGYDREQDAAHYVITESGIVVVPLAPLEQRHPRFTS